MTDEVGSLEAAALKRKQRLAELREAKLKKSSGEGDKLPAPTFRSYKPADESLKELALPDAQIEEITDKVCRCIAFDLFSLRQKNIVKSF